MPRAARPTARGPGLGRCVRSPGPAVRPNRPAGLVLAGLVVVMLPALPFGNYLIYPFVILTTWFHRNGPRSHPRWRWGRAFDRLMIFASGSGVAEKPPGRRCHPRTTFAAIAGRRPARTLHPPGALLILARRDHPRLGRPMLWLVAGQRFIASVVIWVRSPVGYAMLPLVAARCWHWWRGGPKPALARFTLQFLGVLAAMSMLRDFRYLFTEEAVIEGQRVLSDTGQIAAVLGLAALVLGDGDPAGFRR